MSAFTKNVYVPLLLVAGYLIFTLFLLAVGPIRYQLHSAGLFWLLMVFFHAALVFGYVIGVKKAVRVCADRQRRFSEISFYLSFFLASLSVIIALRNATGEFMVNPVAVIQRAIDGIVNPVSAYIETKELGDSQGVGASRLLNVLSFGFAFFKFLFIFQALYWWERLTLIKKSVFYFFVFFAISPGLISGVNSTIFILFIFIFFSRAATLLFKPGAKIRGTAVVFAFCLLSLVPIGWFGYLMGGRGGVIETIPAVSPLGDVAVAAYVRDLDPGSFITFYVYSVVWLLSYVLQGYYGFSLIIGKSFDWTYGFGSSPFLQRQFEVFTGVDLSAYTFQRKVSDVWGETSNWHSVYGQLANDYSVVGVVLPMFALGFLFARVWMSVVVNRSFFGMALLPMFALMFFFFPASNLVFGYIDTFSYFVVVFMFWVMEGKRFSRQH